MDKQLEELFDFINGPLMKSITTYPDRDENNTKLHSALLELEKLGKVKRHLEAETYVVWMSTI